MRWRRLGASMMLFAFPCLVEAQPRQRPPIEQRQVQPDRSDSAERARLEQSIRRGFARAVQQRVGLSNEQMRRLAPVTQRHEERRRQLLMDERATRMQLRMLLRDGSSDQGAVEQLLQQLVEGQKRRAQLLEEEQRDLAVIMTPVQRARYMALQEQIRMRLEQIRRGRTPMMDRNEGPPGRPFR